MSEGRFADKHRVEDPVRRVGIGVLLDTSAGERTVTYIHRKEQIIDSLLPVHRQHHMLRLMLNDRTDESEEIVDMVRTQIVFERLGFLAAQRINPKTDGVDEVAVMLDVITPLRDAAYVNRMTGAFEKPTQRLFVLLG